MFTYKYTSYIYDTESESFNELLYNYHQSFHNLKGMKDGITEEAQQSLVSFILVKIHFIV